MHLFVVPVLGLVAFDKQVVGLEKEIKENFFKSSLAMWFAGAVCGFLDWSLGFYGFSIPLFILFMFLIVLPKPNENKKRILNLKRNDSDESWSNEDFCYVYLMLNVENGYYKIGISKTPEKREKTLQAQEPLIEIVEKEMFPTRKLAMAVERGLHIKFKRKRLRGEWIELDKNDILEVIKIIKN